MIDVLNFIAWL